MIKMPGDSFKGILPPLNSQEIKLAERLKMHIEKLAAEIGERNMFKYAALIAAGEYIKNTWESFGLNVIKQCYQCKKREACNYIVEFSGNSKPQDIVVIGAHYDSVYGSPGANDNGSGVAAILELAHLIDHAKCEKTLRFVAFANEEPPYFNSQAMGSYHYAQQAKLNNENIIAMLSIETIGYYSDEPFSQKYPFPYMFFYPEIGNFIGFVSNLTNKKLLHQCIASFRQHCQFPSEGAAAPSFLPGVSWSDQWSFWRFGYPAIMITDTALFRYPYYHNVEDTPDKIHYEKMARVVYALNFIIENLVNSKT